eukprot:7174706-Alexandrium_andersonii.AAC.1
MRTEPGSWATPAAGLALPACSGQVVLRCLGHEGPAREARGAAEQVAGWARVKRADVRVIAS